MKRLVLVCALVLCVGLCIGAAAVKVPPMFTKSPQVLLNWTSVQENQGALLGYIQANAPNQAFLDGVEAMMFPELNEQGLAVGYSQLSNLAEVMNLEKKTDDPKVQALLDAIEALKAPVAEE